MAETSCNQLLLIVSATFILIKIGLLVINVAMVLNDVIDTGTVRVKPYLEYKMQIKIKHVDVDYSEVHACLYLIQMYVHLHMYT